MRGRNLIIALLVIIVAGIAAGVFHLRNPKTNLTGSTPVTLESGVPQVQPSIAVSPVPQPSGSPGLVNGSKQSNMTPDLTPDASGLSKATVVILTKHGMIRYKFYPNDAPMTVKRMVELINSGFYNGLTFHRVVPGFVVQGGDPQGNGTGGSGQHMKAEFNARRHIDGAVAMARAGDPDSADSQFYITLGVQPHLDRQYTVFGQVIEGMDAVRKIQPGDQMTSVIIE